jgi:Na+/glutamate symporter
VKVGLAAALVGLVFLVVAGVILRRYVTEGDEEEDLETAEVTIE